MNIIQCCAFDVYKNWGGICLSTDFMYGDILSFRCIRGHEFKRSVKEIKEGKFCELCNIQGDMNGLDNIISKASKTFKNVIDTFSYLAFSIKLLKE